MTQHDVKPWVGLGLILLTLLAGCVWFIQTQWKQDSEQMRRSTETETALLASVVRNDLQQGHYQHVPVLLEEWGSRYDDIASLKVEAHNGFIIGEYLRPDAAQKNYTTSAAVDYSYNRRAVLTFVRDMGPLYHHRTTSAVQLSVLFLAFAVLLIVATRFLLLHRSEATALRTRSDELAESNRQLADEIRQRLAAQFELQQYRDQLEQLVKQRTAQLQLSNHELEAFSYSVSHDLRGPLRGIDGFCQALLEDYSPVLDDTGRDYLRRVRAGAQRMGHIIDDLLKLARVTRANLEPTSIDLSAMAQSIVRELQAREPQRKVTVIVEPDLRCWGDRGLMGIVMENLLENAWKFTARQAQPEITFAVKSQGNNRVYCVEDNGAGFDMSNAPRLFKPFERMHSVTEYDGTGIGLATVHRIIERHGGRVWAQAEVNQGATFCFTLPDSPAPAPQLERTPAS